MSTPEAAAEATREARENVYPDIPTRVVVGVAAKNLAGARSLVAAIATSRSRPSAVARTLLEHPGSCREYNCYAHWDLPAPLPLETRQAASVALRFLLGAEGIPVAEGETLPIRKDTRFADISELAVGPRSLGEIFARCIGGTDDFAKARLRAIDRGWCSVFGGDVRIGRAFSMGAAKGWDAEAFAAAFGS